ncbi:MAG: SixA phosphatase family protein [Candidatus Dormibacterales bacterium]
MSRPDRGRESSAAKPRDEREPGVPSHKFYVVRHAKAGDREAWTGDDRKRPLTKKGQAQAEGLVASFESLPISSVISSPYLRCVQTVEPLARARRLSVRESAALVEGQGLAGAMTFLTDPKLADAVLCTHGDVVWELVEFLVGLNVVVAGAGGFEKGSTWQVEMRAGVPVQAAFIPPP